MKWKILSSTADLSKFSSNLVFLLVNININGKLFLDSVEKEKYKEKVNEKPKRIALEAA